MTQVARPVKIMGIIDARMSERFLTLMLPFARNAGPIKSWRRAPPVSESFAETAAPKEAPSGASAEMKIKNVVTSRAMKMAAPPRMRLKSRLCLLFMADPPNLFRGLLLQAQHVFAHLLVGEAGRVFKVSGNPSAVHDH
ncbi:hypothetical protein SDC9_153153 [bioreactor metagenome]|uniref:Uncharacterized protein n=1 Tax=bioreactor metagenome TaxID=1076179 RepID=A0A645EXK5_9ZZZZ